jgi:transcriptional regulator with XRE-family HTH domain
MTAVKIRHFREPGDKAATPFHSRFARNLYTLRIKAEIAQQDVERNLGMQAGNLAHWEAGKGLPHLTKIPALCRLLKCSMEQLLEGCP